MKMKKVICFLVMLLFAAVGISAFSSQNAYAAHWTSFSKSGTYQTGGYISGSAYHSDTSSWACKIYFNGVDSDSAGANSGTGSGTKSTSCTIPAGKTSVTFKFWCATGGTVLFGPYPVTAPPPPSISSVSATPSSVTYPSGNISVSVSGSNMGSSVSWRVLNNGSDTSVTGTAYGSSSSCSFSIPTSGFQTSWTNISVRCATNKNGSWAEKTSNSISVNYPTPRTTTVWGAPSFTLISPVIINTPISFKYTYTVAGQTGSANITYKIFKDGSQLTSGTASTYSSNVTSQTGTFSYTPTSSGSYYCIFADNTGHSTQSNAVTAQGITPTLTGATLNKTSATYGETLSFSVTGSNISKVTYIILYSTTTPGTTGSGSSADPPGWTRFGTGQTVTSTNGISLGSMMDTSWKYVTVKAVVQSSTNDWGANSWTAPACKLNPAPPPSIFYQPIFKDNGGSSVSLLAYISNATTVAYKVFYTTATTPPSGNNTKYSGGTDNISGWTAGSTGNLSNTGTNTWTGSAGIPSGAKYAIFKVWAGSPGNAGETWFTQVYKVSPGAATIQGDWFKTRAMSIFGPDGSLDFESLCKMDMYINGKYMGYTYCGVEQLGSIGGGRNVIGVGQWNSVKQYFNNVAPPTQCSISYDSNVYYFYAVRDIVNNIPGSSITWDGVKLEYYITMPVIPTVTTQTVTGITGTSATGNGNVTALGSPSPSQHGIVWSTSTNPTTALSTKTTLGARSATGAFTSSITGLTAGTKYYVRAYATNTAGTAYGNEVTFTTNGPPAVSTQSVSNITNTSAIGNGTIISLGAPNPTQYGHVWSTSPNPTTALSTKTALGARSTTGAFTSSITGLTAGTTYYVRAYATNSSGTAYGNEVTFMPGALPTVTTQNATNITTTIATGNGNVTALGAPNPTQYGHVWGTTTGPTVALATKTQLGVRSFTGAFTSNITGLLPGTKYYIRSYATNIAGTVYGNEITLTTVAQLAVTTNPVSNITSTTVTGNGTIVSLGTPNPTQHGFVWSTTSGPTIALTTKTQLGARSTTGSFTSNITGLTAGTTYYIRAYATNTGGTVYGTETTFSTTAPAAVTTLPTTNVSALTATGNANITNLGVPNPTQYGHVWGTTTGPTVALATKTQLGATSTIGTFTSNLTGLAPMTTYYVRAYIINAGGTVYGNEVTFTTSQLGAPSITSDVVSNTANIDKKDVRLVINPPAYADATTRYNFYYGELNTAGTAFLNATDGTIAKATNISLSSNSYTIAGMDVGKVYGLQVSATHNGSQSLVSTPIYSIDLRKPTTNISYALFENDAVNTGKYKATLTITTAESVPLHSVRLIYEVHNNTGDSVAVPSTTINRADSGVNQFAIEIPNLTNNVHILVTVYVTSSANIRGTVVSQTFGLNVLGGLQTFLGQTQHNQILNNGTEISAPVANSVIANADYGRYKYEFNLSNTSSIQTVTVNLLFNSFYIDGAELSLTTPNCELKLYKGDTLLKTFSSAEIASAKASTNRYTISFGSSLLSGDGAYNIRYRGQLFIRNDNFTVGTMKNEGTIVITDLSGTVLPQVNGTKNYIDSTISKYYPTA